MALKSYKPTSPGRRLTTSPDFAELTKGKKPEKSLTAPLKSTGGRNVYDILRHQALVLTQAAAKALEGALS